jgi:2,5-diamino-6-hydroxy-4-(5-phosphoribosylamino)pyrimidine 1'-reductase
MNKPYIVINSAVSCDGKISSSERKRITLSDEVDFQEVDMIRSQCDAILVGAKTVNSDNPKLIIKSEINRKYIEQLGKSIDPTKVTLSRTCDFDPESNYFNSGDGEKIVFTTELAPIENIRRIEGRSTVIKQGKTGVDLRLMCETLYKRGIRTLLVEGGGITNFEFIQAGIADEIRMAIAPIIIGGSLSPTMVDGVGFTKDHFTDLELIEVRKIGQMAIVRYKVKNRNDR